jgi:hypothetical protein
VTYSPVPVLEQHGVRLTATGEDRYRCACPVHNGGSGSMAVSKANGRWQITCFACGFSGGTPDLVMALRRCTLGEAFRFLSGQPVDDVCPVPLHRERVLTLACDAAGCGRTLDVKGATYKTAGAAGYTWTTTAEDEAVYGHGWEIGAHAEFALCVECVT